MQSFMQYRRLGLNVRRLLESDFERGDIPISQLHAVRKADRDPNATPSAPNAGQNNDIQDLSLELDGITTVRTKQSIRTALGHKLNGVHPRARAKHEGDGGKLFVVTWGDDDPSNPRNWSYGYRLLITALVGCIAFVVTAGAAADTAVLPQAASEFGVSDVVMSLSIGIYLVGLAAGATFVGPISETLGRNFVYVSTLITFMIFVMAAALVRNIGTYLLFRFLAGVFGAAPMTCSGGSISDMWSSIEKTFGFPVFAATGFIGAMLIPVMGSYVTNIGSWRWTEWIVLLLSAVVLGLVIISMPETFPPLLLKWKARHLRHQTGDDRYQAECEIIQEPLGTRLKTSLSRAFLFAMEPIVICITLNLTVLYIIYFTFLDGYRVIFQEVYGISQGLTNVIFLGQVVGVLLGTLPVPWIYRATKTTFVNNTFVPEIRLWFAMLGAPAIPIALFWMGWTDYASISIWSPIMASVLLGYGIICIFNSAYMYIIDSYEINAASALTFVTFTRYSIAGGMTVVGVPMYKNLGPHYTLTLLGCISCLITPIPYVFYKYGHIIRQRSKNAVSPY